MTSFSFLGELTL